MALNSHYKWPRGCRYVLLRYFRNRVVFWRNNVKFTSAVPAILSINAPKNQLIYFQKNMTKSRGHSVAQLVGALRYRLEGRVFVSCWCHCNFSLTQSFRSHYDPGVDSVSNRNEYQEYFLWGKGGRCLGLTTLPPHVLTLLKSGSLNLLEPSRACPGM